uniref:Uncharacterized protein n=1 Tax=Oryza rufipogon TaxID=4529 RepID=A0A0E0QXS0_ORYRU
MSRDELVPITRVHEEAPLTETSIAVDAIITRNLEDAARDDAILPTTDGGAFVVDLHLREEPGGRSGGLAGGDEVVVASSGHPSIHYYMAWARARIGVGEGVAMYSEPAAACGWRREETAWRRTDVDGDCFPSDVRALRCLLAVFRFPSLLSDSDSAAACISPHLPQLLSILGRVHFSVPVKIYLDLPYVFS